MAINDMNLSGKIRADGGSGANGLTVYLLETDAALNGTEQATDTTDSNGTWNFTLTTADLNDTYDVKIESSSGAQIRYIPWSDEITLKTVDTSVLKVRGLNSAAAPLYLFADRGDDAGDGWRVQATNSNTLAIGSNKAAIGTIIDYITITNGATAAASNTTILGQLTVGVDDTGADVKFFGASAGAYMLYDESADTLEVRGPSADATTSTGKLLLSTALTDINANDVIGKIDFQAPLEAGGTDAITVAASIQAIAQGTFSASVNATDLVFYTGHSEAATEKFRFTSQGELGIGGATYGSSGDVLTSGGAGAAASWTTPSSTLVTGVTAGVGLSGGGTEGTVTLTLDLSELSTVTPADGDFFATLDSDGANEQKTTTTALATLLAGTVTSTGLAASSSVLSLDIQNMTELASGGVVAADEIAISDGGTLKKIGVDNFIIDTPALVSEATIANGDYVLFLDGGATGSAKKEALADLVGVIAGTVTSTGLSDSGSVLSLDIQNMTASTTIADADLIVIDDGAGGTLRKMTRANFIESAALDAINIDGGAIDGAVIGANSAAAVTGTTIIASTSVDITGSAGLILENDETITNSTNGLISLSGNLAIPNGGTIGTASDTDSITIASAGAVTFSQAVTVAGNLDLNNTGTLLNVGAAGNDWTAYRIFLSNTRSGANIDVICNNLANDDAASHAIIHAKTGGADGGDPTIRMEIQGAEEVRMGLDNSTATDNFVISDSGALGTNDRLRLVTTTGVLSVDGDGGGSDDPVSLFDDYDDVAEIRRFQLAIPGAPISIAQRDENRQRLVEIGVGEWAVQESGPDHWMMRMQPLTRLLAGGIYQTREKVYELEERLAALEAKGA